MAPKLLKKRLTFRNLTKLFSYLRNCDLYLKISDGEYSDTEEIAIGKRKGTEQFSFNINDDSAAHSQFLYKNSTNGDGDHIVAAGTNLKKKGESAWEDIKTGLADGKFFGGLSINSYYGSGTTPAIVAPKYTGTWSSVSVTAGITKLVSSGTPGWIADDLIGRVVVPDSANDPAHKYTIIDNNSNTVWVEGDVSAVASSGDAFEIAFASMTSVLVDTNANFTIDEYAGKVVRITSGVGAGQVRRIASNVKDALTLQLPWDKEPDETSYYSIYSDEEQVLYLGNGIDATMRWDGTQSNPVDVANMPKGNLFMEYESRVVIAGDPANPYSVYYSDIGDPEFFDPTFVIRPPGNDKVVGIAKWNDKGIIFKEKSIWIFTFEFNDAVSIWQVGLKQLPENFGCASGRSIQEVNNELWFFTGKELRALGASETQIGVVRTRNLGFDIKNLLDAIPESEYDKVCSFANGEKYIISFPETQYQIVYSIPYKTFLVWDGFYPYSFLENGIDICAGTKINGGKILKLNSDNFSDSGAAINQIIKTKGWTDGDESEMKLVPFVNLVFENIPGSANVVAEATNFTSVISVDSHHSIGQTYSSGGALGSNQLGSFAFGGGTVKKNRFTVRKTVAKYGMTFQVTISNNEIDENVILVGITYYVMPRGARRFSKGFTI